MQREPTSAADFDDWPAALRSGRAQAVAALRARLHAGLRAALIRRADVGDADVDDFTQEAVVRVLERLDSFRGESRFTTWAMAVAIRESLTALRRRRWAERPSEATAKHAAAADSDCGPGEGQTHAEMLDVLRRAVEDELTPRQRQVLLGELAGAPGAALAESLATTPGAVYKLAHDARRKLKSALERMGYDAQGVAETLAHDC